MAIKAGRVGVNPLDVDPISGRINSSSTEGYTKAEADDKFLAKSDASDTYETKSDASTALAAKQPINLQVPIPMLDGTKLTVESALQGLNTEKANAETTYSKTQANDKFVDKVVGDVNAVFLNVLYGTAENSVNIDTLNKPRGYLMRIQNGLQFSGTLPSNIGGVNAFILLGFSSIVSGDKVEYGCQLLIPFGASGKIYIRQNNFSASGTDWNDWKEIIATAIV